MFIYSLLIFWMLGAGLAETSGEDVGYTLERAVAHRGFDGETCWVHARAGAIPAEAMGEDVQQPLVVMTMQKLLLTGSDVFYELHETRSQDRGETWTEPTPQTAFRRQRVDADASAALPTGAAIAPQFLQPGDETTVCDFSPQWHPSSQRLLGIGQTVWYRDNRVMHTRPRGIAYAVYDPKRHQWGAWDTVRLPDEAKFKNAGAGSVQRVDLPGGDILLPIYFKAPQDEQYSVTVCRCRFDGKTLQYLEHGSELTVPVKRGLYEPSLTEFQGRYYLTMRNDDHGYVSVSPNGLDFETPRQWTFDDGSDLGNYNTQQHWVTHSDDLFLAYTRRGADNDHVFRHRAPLFLARVDHDRLRVVRHSEQIAVPERGARLGNFGVVDVSEDETWVTAAEWMQPLGVEQHGSDNSLFIAKLKWDRPNRRLVSADRSTHVPWDVVRGYTMPPLAYRDDLGEYRSPLVFADGSRVKTPADWQRRRVEILSQWEQQLGKWPPLNEAPELEILESQRRENFIQHRVRFPWTPHEITEGYLLVPDAEETGAEGHNSAGRDTEGHNSAGRDTEGHNSAGRDAKGRRPAVVTVYYEPETAIGERTPNRDYALQLARRGFVVLSIGATEATAAGTYGLYYPSIEDAQVQPLSMLAYAAASAWHVLANRPEVDSDRIGIVGHSFGGKWAMFASCLFDKFACGVWSDPGIVFDETRPNVNYWEPWYLGYHPKPWRNRGVIRNDNPARGLYPELRKQGLDLHELHALMAPRPFLVSGGSEDPLHRWQALNHSRQVNRVLGQEHRVAMTNRPDHGPNEDANAVVYAFFEHFLARDVAGD